MTAINLNIRTDKDIKDQAESIFNELGLSLTDAVNIFLRAVVRANGFPFSINLNTASNPGIEAMKTASRIAASRGISDMPMDEINAEIAAARK